MNSIDLCNLDDVRQALNTAPSPIASTSVTTPGSGYSTITITVVPVDGNGSGAVLTGGLIGGVLVAVLITAPGKGYTRTPLLVVTGDGTGATATCTLNEDASLSRLITAASSFILARTGRPSFGTTVIASEVRNGNGQVTINPYFWPIISVQGVGIGNSVIPPVPAQGQAGFGFDNFTIFSINGASAFGRGFQNITLAYTYGWAVIPQDVSQACIELVAQKYRRQQHVDQTSQTLGGSGSGSVVAFSTKDIPPEVQTVITDYKIKVVIE